jgi:hypothetical protein
MHHILRMIVKGGQVAAGMDHLIDFGVGAKFYKPVNEGSPSEVALV